MTKYIFIIFFLFCINLYSIEYDFEVITLPYDSLSIEDIVVANFTILARSGNTIYKSTDDGNNWKIAHQSQLNIKQLYSKDPHTILIVGEKGMIYRTMDYGETWLDEKVDVYDIDAIAAKDYSNFLAIANNKWIYYKSDNDSNWQIFNKQSPFYLSSIVYAEGKYHYGGGSNSRDYYYRNNHYYEFIMNVITFDGTNFGDIRIGYESGGYDRAQKRKVDSLRLYNLSDSLYASAMDYNVCYVTNNKDFLFNYEKYEQLYKIKEDEAICLLNFSDSVYVFSKKGSLEIVLKENMRNYGNTKEVYDLNIDVVNSIVNPYKKTIYLASNNSKIYKMSVYDVPSSVEVQSDNKVKQYGNEIWFDEDISDIQIYDYIGKKVNLESVTQDKILLSKGIYFIRYQTKNKYYSLKVMVN